MAKKHILILILILAAVLRLYGLNRGDTVNDEIFMSFRGIGMLDFDEAETQTTPWEWFDKLTINGLSDDQRLTDGKTIPWWINLSFHDHPLAVPLTQHIFMNFLGESQMAFRLPSALLGIASVYLLYLIGMALYSETAGLFSAGLFAVTLNNIYITRTGMQEPYVIFFILLASYLFLRARQNARYFIWLGAALGLGLSAKYTSAILIPIFIFYLLVYNRNAFRQKQFWLGAAIALFLFSPSIIYNLNLYREFGHFDFQISNILGNAPEEWQNSVGKEVGTPAERIKQFIPRLIATNSWLFLSLAAISYLIFLFAIIRKPSETLKKHAFLLIATLGIAALIIGFIGPSYRFLTILTPFMALSASLSLDGFFHSNVVKNVEMKKWASGALIAFFIFEIFYSYNNQIAYYPIGASPAEPRKNSPWLTSLVRLENYNWGYNALGNWLETELKGKIPAITFDLQYQFLEKFRDSALKSGLARGYETYSALIVYDGNFDRAGRLWALDRLHIYHAWPIISAETYSKYLKENGADFYKKAGFKNFYYITQPGYLSLYDISALKIGEIIPIKNPYGNETFLVYKSEK